MKNSTKVMTSFLVALALLLVIGVTDTNAAYTFVRLNCSYDSLITPSNGAILESGVQYKTSGETYTTNDRDEITFTIRAMANSNYTNVTTYPPVLFWDGVARAATVAALGRSNVTGASNASIILSNETDYTHTYYMRYYINNASISLLGNITSCASDVSCTSYDGDGDGAGNYENLTIMDCPTRTVTLHYRSAGAAQQQAAVAEAAAKETKDNTTIGVIFVIGIIALFVYLKGKDK